MQLSCNNEGEVFRTKMPSVQKSTPKNTRIRSELLEIFSNGDLFSVPDLLGAIEKKGITANKTTLYRQLETLTEQGIIESVSLFPGVLHYETTSIHGHHHHLICKGCNAVEHIHTHELETTIHNLEQSLQAKTGFSSLSHSLSFFGLCKICTA